MFDKIKFCENDKNVCLNDVQVKLKFGHAA